MLNDAQRTSLRIVMSMIEERMRAIEFRLDHPEEQGLMFEIRNNITCDMVHALREKIPEVYGLIRILRDRLALPREIKPASRELLTGLSQLWVVLQESDSKRLQRFGDIDPALAPALDPEIETLARLVFELENAALGHVEPAAQAVGQEQKGPGERQRP